MTLANSMKFTGIASVRRVPLFNGSCVMPSELPVIASKNVSTTIPIEKPGQVLATTMKDSQAQPYTLRSAFVC